MVSEVIKKNLLTSKERLWLATDLKTKKKRVLVKFQDLNDREAVYQARFDKPQETNKGIIHENLTEARANMIRNLGQMREKSMIVCKLSHKKWYHICQELQGQQVHNH